MEKLRVGIIGTGGIALAHATGYEQASDLAQMTACCDIDVEKAKSFAKAHGIPETSVYRNCEEMLQNEALDCVSVCTMNSVHKECTVAALKAGLPVLCEKPMAMNTAEAQEMYDLAQKAGKLLQIGFVRRFGEDAEIFRSFAKAGTFGDIYYAKAVYTRRDGCPGGWFKDKSCSGGGPLIDLGVHVIDLCRYLAGNPKPVSVFGLTYSNLGPNRAAGAASDWSVAGGDAHPYNVEDFCGALIRFDNGFAIQLETSFNLNCAGPSAYIQLFGTKAGAALRSEMEIYTTMAGKHVNIKPLGNTKFEFQPSFNKEVRNFCNAVKGTEESRANAEDGLIVMKIVDAIYESARTGRSVDIQ